MILTEGFLRAAIKRDNVNSSYNQRIIRNVNESLYFEKKSYDMFISHSYLDKELVYELVNLFNISGYTVYVDWIEDQELERSFVTESSAELLRKRMQRCKGLSYIATDNVANSKWCPWELGYFDGFRENKCCIMPVLEKLQQTYYGQEYLGIYPYIEYDIHYENKEWDFWICKSTGEYVVLSEWLRAREPRWRDSPIKY